MSVFGKMRMKAKPSCARGTPQVLSDSRIKEDRSLSRQGTFVNITEEGEN